MAAVVSAALTLAVLFVSGYARFRAPADNTGLWLLGVAVVSGWFTAGVLRGGWNLLVVPQALLVVTATWFWFVSGEHEWFRRRSSTSEGRRT